MLQALTMCIRSSRKLLTFRIRGFITFANMSFTSCLQRSESHEQFDKKSDRSRPILILGGTGKTGRRVAERLQARGVAVQMASRSGDTPFDWTDTSGWAPALAGVGAVYITYYPDLAVPGAADAVGAFARLAVDNGVKRLVLLSGRGEEEAQHAEQELIASGADWTIVRASWFAQNFSEGFLRRRRDRRRGGAAGRQRDRALRGRRGYRRRSCRPR